MSDCEPQYRVKVFYYVETWDSGIVEESGIIGPVKDQEEYTHQLDVFKNRLSRRWRVPLNRITPHTGELLREAPQ